MPFVATGYAAVFLLNMLFAYAKNYCTNRFVNRVSFRAKMEILTGFFERDFTEYDNQSVGDMKMRLEDDTNCIADYAGKQTIDYAASYVTLIISTVLLFLIEWRLAIFACIGILLTFWLDNIIAKREAVVQNRQRENDQIMSSWLHASVQGWREVKALNLQRHEEKQFVRYIHNFAVYFGTWINYWVARVLIVPKIKEEFLMRFCLYFFGGLLIIAGHFEIGSLLVFMQYYALLSGALEAVSGADAELLSAKPKSERLLSELYRAAEKKTGLDLPDGSGDILFRDVTFAYPDSEQSIINRLTFSISKGECVAITGRSGAGKTTALKLMLGLLRPISGEVLFSDVSVKDIRPDVLHKHFGFVMQENALFNASIKENLLYAMPNATNDELADACKKAFILDFINSLPNGMDTVIGERGIKLSGGQKQRIVLARQFLRDVDVFIFDEATSALDQYSESMIQDAIQSIGKDKTIIIVAHRKSSLVLCDRVIAL
jgi:ATP-binding cassette subfamily B protein/subfamily B ATP-binding cassette protein MsbA